MYDLCTAVVQVHVCTVCGAHVQRTGTGMPKKANGVLLRNTADLCSFKLQTQQQFSWHGMA